MDGRTSQRIELPFDDLGSKLLSDRIDIVHAEIHGRRRGEFTTGVFGALGEEQPRGFVPRDRNERRLRRAIGGEVRS